jgi:hypothetical protein
MKNLLLVAVCLSLNGCAISPLKSEYWSGMGSRAALGFNEAACRYPGANLEKCQKVFEKLLEKQKKESSK